jgi:ubiquinone/menaquinone biosynthesis C-methylase UbiE
LAEILNKNMLCLVCGNNKLRKYYYPEVRFNNKTFNYYECTSCRSAQIDPMPNADDYAKMYGVNDHTYLTKLKASESVNFERIFPKYNHQKYQVDFFSKYNYHLSGKTLLDYGCGSGFYMYHAKKQGLECTGVEFNSEFASLLKEKTGLTILTVTEISGKTFDIVHLGHVLEHMENPFITMEELKKYGHKDTLFIIDGPLEKNRCLTRWMIKLISLIKNKKFNTYSPQHLTFTNYSSQLLLLEKAGFKKINYEVQEQMFPLPEVLNLMDPFKSLLFIVSRISINISKLHPKWGNVFHYAGKINS